ncbi:unnamed protein product [Malus baccata var. baccata]
MGRLKAPGPDDFQRIFYHSFWEDLKADVNSLIHTMLQDEVCPDTLNATHVVLIPMVPNPEMVSQFRPISLCNYSYKVPSKVLANRLKVVLPNIISPSQNAFVANRQIHDNIGIAHEMFHFLKGRKAKTKYELGFKIDMQKAYDRVEWDFLDAIMGIMGFCNRWRQLVMGCVSYVQFVILLNGQPGKSFVPSYGIRQGDPLSHFLSLLVGEVFSGLIQKAVHDKLLDVDLINMYCDASDNKSTFKNQVSILERIFLSGSLLSWLIFFVSRFCMIPELIWGVPAIWGRLKKRGLAYIKERIMGKQCWRLISDPTALWARVVKARYFLNCSFWDATKEGRASWAWTSLLVGREVIQNGSHRQIMGGHDVRVWVDCWLPSLTSGHPEVLGEVAVSPNLPVNSLIFHKSLEWDIDFLQPFIYEEAQLAIKCLPLGDIRCKDRLVYDASKNGKYSVKSGYRWLQMRSLASRDHRLPRTRVIPKKLWNLEVLVRYPGCTEERKWVPINPIKVLLEVSSTIGYYWEAMGWTGNRAARPSACCVQFMAVERYAFSPPSVAAAEVTALLRGCELGTSLGFQSVILESDSRESIDWLSGAVDVGSWEAYPVLMKVKLVSEAFQFCRWSWVPITANGAADFLAYRGFQEMGSRVWVDMPPSSLVLVLNKDGLPCPP